MVIIKVLDRIHNPLRTTVRASDEGISEEYRVIQASIAHIRMRPHYRYELAGLLFFAVATSGCQYG